MKDLKKYIKLSKKSWITIIIGVVIIAVASLSVYYFQQINQYNKINEQLIQIRTNLEKTQVPLLQSNKTELEQELSAKTLQLENAQAQLSIPMASSIITKTLFDVADSHRLTVNEMSSSMPQTQSQSGVELSQTELTASVEGNLSDIIRFIIALDKRFSTGVIKSVVIEILDDIEGDSSIDFKMDIYNVER